MGLEDECRAEQTSELWSFDFTYAIPTCLATANNEQHNGLQLSFYRRIFPPPDVAILPTNLEVPRAERAHDASSGGVRSARGSARPVSVLLHKTAHGKASMEFWHVRKSKGRKLKTH